MKNKELNEAFDDLKLKFDKWIAFAGRLDEHKIDEIEDKIITIQDSYKNFFEPRFNPDGEPEEIPKSQWFDEKRDEIEGLLKQFNLYEKSIEKLQTRAEKLTQAVTENATFDSFKTQAKTYRS